MTKEKYSQLKILDILRWLLDFICDQTRRNFRVISSVALHSAATAAFLLLLRELEPESENCAQMLSGGELQGWRDCVAHSWCGGLVVAACCAVSRRASLCRLGLGPREERKKSPPTRGGVACLFIMHHGKLCFALGPGLAKMY